MNNGKVSNYFRRPYGALTLQWLCVIGGFAVLHPRLTSCAPPALLYSSHIPPSLAPTGWVPSLSPPIAGGLSSLSKPDTPVTELLSSSLSTFIAFTFTEGDI